MEYANISKMGNGQSYKMTKYPYNKTYFEEIGIGSANSAAVVIPIVQQMLTPKSVVDIGCGIGIWLAEWQRHGVNDILGIDGEYIDKEQLKISPDFFLAQDLEKPFLGNRKFDLVQSLEVAEHLKHEFAANFISQLCNLGNIVLFSAAIPAQGGINHFNEQYPDYWINLFAQNNFTAYDCLRKIIWNYNAVDTCYRQNILLFIRNDIKQHFPNITGSEEPILNLVHPETYAVKNRIINDYEKITSSVLHATWFIFKKRMKKILKRLGLWI